MGDFSDNDRALLVSTATKVSAIEGRLKTLVTKDAFRPVSWRPGTWRRPRDIAGSG